MAVSDDLEFDDDDVFQHNGRTVYAVNGVLPGGIAIIDGNGEVVIADQIESFDIFGRVEGVEIVLDDFLVDGHIVGTWKVRYNRGEKGHDGLSASVSDATLDEIILYSLIFG